MRYIKTFIKTICFSVSVFFLQGCSDVGIIKKKTMVSIVQDMYLADQYIEKTPHLRAQTDSLFVYPAILAKYGYTMDDYANSIRYWLQQGEEYNSILELAQEAMEEKVNVMEVEILRQQRLAIGPQRWWALDSARRVAPEELLYDRLLRGVRWLVIPGERLQKWAMMDSAIVDIPQNPAWWINNMVCMDRDYTDYLIFETRKGVKAGGGTSAVKNPRRGPENLRPYTRPGLFDKKDMKEPEEASEWK